jgi:hypothetical protein
MVGVRALARFWESAAFDGIGVGQPCFLSIVLILSYPE